MPVHSVRKPWWQQATALTAVTTGGVITGLTFVPGSPATVTSPTHLPIQLLALDKSAKGELSGQAAGSAASADSALRSAIVNVATHYLNLAASLDPAQMERMIWAADSTDGADHGPTCAAFASLTLELAAQAVGQRSWVTGGSSYPWPLHAWADARVDPNPDSLAVTSILQDAQAHGRWHPLGDGYQPRPGDWVLFDQHVEVVTGEADGLLSTIGADSLPNYSVNAHSYSGSLAADGVAGFVDNGHLTGAGRPAPPGAPAGGAGTDAATRSGGQGTRTGDADVPGLPAPGAAQAPGHAGDAEIPGLGASSRARSARPRTAAPSAAARPKAARRRGAARQAAPGEGAQPRAAADIPGLMPPPMTAAASASGAASGRSPAAPNAYRKHSAPAAETPATSAQQAFISEVAPGAMAAQRRYGVPASVTIAQAIDESGWGRSSLAAKDHNLFGIKGTGPAGSVTLPTSEYIDGRRVTVDARFRVYRNAAESIADHAQLLATSGYYQQAMADREMPDAFANHLSGIYATDPRYGADLIALMKLYNLYQYDAPAGSAAPAGSGSPGSASFPAGTPNPEPSRQASIPGVPPTPVPVQAQTTSPAPAAAAAPGSAPATARAPATGNAAIPGLPGSARDAAAFVRPVPAGKGTGRAPGGIRRAVPATAARAVPRRYEPRIPLPVSQAFTATARAPLSAQERFYRQVASETAISWKLLAACDWMQCRAHPRYSPVHGERLGTVNSDGTVYMTRLVALTQCACDLVELAAAVYGIDLTARRQLSVPDLAGAFAAFRWGALLRRHRVSPMEFPYSVEGLTADHARMRWPAIKAPEAPDKPGARFRQPFGAVPVVLGLGYPATV